MQKVSFKNRNGDEVGHLYLPKNFAKTKKYPAIVCVHLGSSVKEQTVSLYANKLAKSGFATLIFDASFQGESGGEPRFLEDPATMAEDIRCATDFLTTLAFVDSKLIGAMGVCAGGGYTANVSILEKKIKGIATVAGTNASRAFREASPMET